MANNKVQLADGTVLVDLTDTTATASDVQNGKYFYTADGVKTLGTATGGSSAWTKVAETSYQISTTSTTAATVATWATGHSELWTSDKWVYVRIRDTAGKRTGYFYGTDTFAILAPGLTATTMIRFTPRVNTDGIYNIGTGTYGVYPDTLYSDGRIRIRARYDASSSQTINGTYSVQVYLLDPPTGAPIFT